MNGMKSSEAIAADRLCLIPFSKRYITQRYVAWLNDPEVVRFSCQRFSKHSISSCRKYFETFAGSPHFFWAIVVADHVPEHIGNITATVDIYNRVADIAILIGEKAAWGRGYGSEAFQASIGFLFEKAGIRKVTAGTMSCNRPMLRLMEKVGMADDGRRKRHYFFANEEVDLIHGALFSEHYFQK